MKKKNICIFGFGMVSALLIQRILKTPPNMNSKHDKFFRDAQVNLHIISGMAETFRAINLRHDGAGVLINHVVNEIRNTAEKVMGMLSIKQNSFC